MEILDNDKVLNNIYELYGPFVGKACENSNFLFSESNNTNLPNSILPNTNLQNTNLQNTNLPSTNIIENVQNSTKILEGGNNINLFFDNTDFKIFGYKISIWMLLLFLIIILSLIYYICNYIFSDNIVSYEKVNLDEDVDNDDNSSNKSLNSHSDSETSKSESESKSQSEKSNSEEDSEVSK